MFAKGYHKVLAIGNDCPYLTSRLLLEAAAWLQTQEVVMGPARDGGAYLIGLSESSLRGDDVRQLAWQTRDFYQSLLTYCRTHEFSYAELPLFSDLDTSRDVASFLNGRHLLQSVRRLAQLIGNLLKEGNEAFTRNTCSRPNRFAEAVHFRRGPPVLR